MNRNIKTTSISNEASALIAAEQAKTLAKELGFNEVDQTKIATATSEVAMNIVIHAQGKGSITMKTVGETSRTGVIVIAKDKGPGIMDVEKALQGGNGTKKGLGEGLGAVKRLMDEFAIETKKGRGTTVTFKKWKH